MAKNIPVGAEKNLHSYLRFHFYDSRLRIKVSCPSIFKGIPEPVSHYFGTYNHYARPLSFLVQKIKLGNIKKEDEIVPKL